MARNVARVNDTESKVRAAVEHVFARRNDPLGLVVRAIGLAKARMKIGQVNLASTCTWRSGSPDPDEDRLRVEIEGISPRSRAARRDCLKSPKRSSFR